MTISLASDLSPVTRAVTVTGPGAPGVIVDRNSTAFPNVAFPVGAGGNLTLRALNVTGAYAGVVLVAGGVATVSGVTLSGNTTGLFLGQGGTATMANSTLAGNTAGLYFIGRQGDSGQQHPQRQ